LAKEDKAEMEKRKHDAAASMEWDGKLGRYIGA
jgi:hypothetical protein